MKQRIPLLLVLALSSTYTCAIAQENNQPPKGFRALFNGSDLSGWFGWTTKNPEELWAMSKEELAEYKAESIKDINQHWSVENGELVNDGHGAYARVVDR